MFILLSGFLVVSYSALRGRISVSTQLQYSHKERYLSTALIALDKRETTRECRDCNGRLSCGSTCRVLVTTVDKFISFRLVCKCVNYIHWTVVWFESQDTVNYVL